jgi:hypothetical protein
MQGKAEHVGGGLTGLLQEFYAEKLNELSRHEWGSRLMRQYDINNTYQYIINREEVQLSWLAAAITELGGTVPVEPGSTIVEAPAKGSDGTRSALQNDVSNAQQFVDRWRPRVDAMTNARHRGMLRVILGETLEQKRFFEQALAGQTDLLGKRSEQVGPRVGEVLPTRWIE